MQGASQISFRRRLETLLLYALATMVGATGCSMWMHVGPAPKPTLPTRFNVALDQLVIHSNFEIPSQHRLLQEINGERADLSNKLNLPMSDEKIYVYLFKDGEQFYDFIRQRYPNFPDRRAFFLETDTQLTVYAYWGDRVAEDLRHEVCHGYLHSMVQNLPLWLDEGIAEYCEVPRGTGGIHPSHIADLNKLEKEGRWRPDIRRLEAFRSPADMTEIDYGESWAWVHWLLETTPQRRALLQEYLADLHRTGMAPPLSLYLRKLGGDPERELYDYIHSLDRQGM
ncbi:MAG TPA: DUF1570 domain-containing protein [Pirellulales bacterium]